MLTLIVTLIILVAVVLVLVVLAQNSKGGGLSSQFGGSGASQIVGVKRTGDILERITWGLAIALVVLSMTSTIILKSSDDVQQGPSSPNLEKAQEETLLPGMDESLLEEGDGSTVQPAEEENSLEGLQETETDSAQ